MSESKEPTEPGWYAYSGGAQNMIFLLTRKATFPDPQPRWWAVFDNGTISGVNWGYIEQALGVWDLVPLVPLQAAKEIFHTRECIRRYMEQAPNHQACYRLGCYVVATGKPVGTVGT